mmetsp:Transcript_12041/g.34051  ORF Transcript_12041/g.34051 Transcript_12041/m.34051 type:complete len:473 (-) Transcript_12041:876-2294(-)
MPSCRPAHLPPMVTASTTCLPAWASSPCRAPLPCLAWPAGPRDRAAAPASAMRARAASGRSSEATPAPSRRRPMSSLQRQTCTAPLEGCIPTGSTRSRQIVLLVRVARARAPARKGPPPVPRRLPRLSSSPCITSRTTRWTALRRETSPPSRASVPRAAPRLAPRAAPPWARRAARPPPRSAPHCLPPPPRGGPPCSTSTRALAPCPPLTVPWTILARHSSAEEPRTGMGHPNQPSACATLPWTLTTPRLTAPRARLQSKRRLPSPSRTAQRLAKRPTPTLGRCSRPRQWPPLARWVMQTACTRQFLRQRLRRPHKLLPSWWRPRQSPSLVGTSPRTAARTRAPNQRHLRQTRHRSRCSARGRPWSLMTWTTCSPWRTSRVARRRPRPAWAIPSTGGPRSKAAGRAWRTLTSPSRVTWTATLVCTESLTAIAERASPSSQALSCTSTARRRGRCSKTGHMAPRARSSTRSRG